MKIIFNSLIGCHFKSNSQAVPDEVKLHVVIKEPRIGHLRFSDPGLANARNSKNYELVNRQIKSGIFIITGFWYLFIVLKANVN